MVNFALLSFHVKKIEIEDFFSSRSISSFSISPFFNLFFFDEMTFQPWKMDAIRCPSIAIKTLFFPAIVQYFIVSSQFINHFNPTFENMIHVRCVDIIKKLLELTLYKWISRKNSYRKENKFTLLTVEIAMIVEIRCFLAHWCQSGTSNDVFTALTFFHNANLRSDFT